MTHSCLSPPDRPSRKREAVLDAAQASFLENGYAATSMDLVASRAGVSKATIYAHFKGKDDLFGAVIRRRCQETIGSGLTGVTEGRDARQALTLMARHLLNLLLSPGSLGIYRVVVAEAPRHPDLARAYFEAGPVQGRAFIAEVFQDLDRRGDLSVPDPLRAADQLASMLRGEFFHRILLGLPERPGFTLDSTIAAAVETILRAYAD